ncbi:hypothetical protein [Cohnella sp. GCM10027633]|uniref:hypothetical protein n=1 Tax=unclassified Cohnella TaxID=2636738 RepID=UPI00363F95DB
MDALRAAALRYGEAVLSPTRIVLQAGALTAILEEGGLRSIRWAGVELVRGLYGAVRDRNWGTVPAVLRGLDVRQTDDAFRVSFRAVHREGDIAFHWDGIIEGDASGELRFGMEGQADRDFERNRIGFCVLHPMSHAGIALTADTETGDALTVFPVAISPHQPLCGIRALAYEPAPGVGLRIAFEGETFEMEDQRNWTDASFKTYGTPLALPFPVTVRQGERVSQRVTLMITGALDAPGAASGSTGDDEAAATTLRVTTIPQGAMPALGVALARPIERMADAAAQAIAKLPLAHLHAELDLDGQDWPERLGVALAECERLRVGIVIEAVAGAYSEETVARFASRLAAAGNTEVAAYAFDRRTHVVCEEAAMLLARERQRLGANFRIGGGTRAHFAELNRSGLPSAHIDEVGYAISPQVHAFDRESVMETLEAQSATTANAVRLASGKPVRVGPVTFKQRYNPVATGGDGDAEDSLSAYDPRQHALFGAAWLLGSIRALTAGGASAATYFATTGPLGIVPEVGDPPTPAYQLLRSFAPFKDATPLATIGAPPGVDAFVLRSGSAARLWLANKTAEAPEAKLLLPPCRRAGPLRMLDETELERDRAAGFATRESACSVDEADGGLKVRLLPYAIAIIDFMIEDEHRDEEART